MATCPECDAEIDVDEFDTEKGDPLSCLECGANLVVARVSPIELELTDDDDDDDDEVEEEAGLGDDDDVDEDDDAEEEEDVDE
jgi:alpha-aminoadipate carrier protein LysW